MGTGEGRPADLVPLGGLSVIDQQQARGCIIEAEVLSVGEVDIPLTVPHHDGPVGMHRREQEQVVYPAPPAVDRVEVVSGRGALGIHPVVRPRPRDSAAGNSETRRPEAKLIENAHYA